ncbi:hypothetical protein J7L87_05900, partial [bacterium]|nr:hypothetical protein [bacterium]
MKGKFYIEEKKHKLGKPLIYRDKIICYIDENFSLKNLKLSPEGPVLLALHQTIWSIFHQNFILKEMDFNEEEKKVNLSFSYSHKERKLEGKSEVNFIEEKNRLRLRIKEEIELKEDIKFDCSASNTPMHFFRTQNTSYHNTGVYILEYTDPIPYKIQGPSTPIKEDRPDITAPVWYFDRNWKSPQYKSVIYKRTDNSYILVPCNHAPGHQKDLWEIGYNGFVGCLDNPEAQFIIEIKNSSLPTVCHFCMWGFDIHFWLVFNEEIENYENPVVKKGKKYSVEYEIKIPDKKWTQKILREAKMAEEFTLDKHLRNVPAYIEGLNRFDEKLGLFDVRPFWQRSSLLFWDKSEGFTDKNSLSIYHQENTKNSWKLQLGQSQFGNPIKGKTKYRLSGYIKTNLENGYGRIGMRFLKVEKPGYGEKHIWTDFYYSKKVEGKNDWQKVEVEAETPEGEIFVVEIIFELNGKG